MLVGLFSYIVTGSSVITYPLKIIFLIVIAGHPEKHRDSRTGRHFRGGAVRKNTGIPGQEDISEGGHPEKHRDSRTEDISEGGHPEKHRDSRTGRHFRGGASGKTQGFPDRSPFRA